MIDVRLGTDIRHESRFQLFLLRRTLRACIDLTDDLLALTTAVLDAFFAIARPESTFLRRPTAGGILLLADRDDDTMTSRLGGRNLITKIASEHRGRPSSMNWVGARRVKRQGSRRENCLASARSVFRVSAGNAGFHRCEASICQRISAFEFLSNQKFLFGQSR